MLVPLKSGTPVKPASKQAETRVEIKFENIFDRRSNDMVSGGSRGV